MSRDGRDTNPACSSSLGAYSQPRGVDGGALPIPETDHTGKPKEQALIESLGRLIAQWRERSRVQWAADFNLSSEHGIRRRYDVRDIQDAIERCAVELEALLGPERSR